LHGLRFDEMALSCGDFKAGKIHDLSLAPPKSNLCRTVDARQTDLVF
jgi:hypothetical protein